MKAMAFLPLLILGALIPGRLGAADPSAVNKLITGLGPESDVMERRNAAEALGKIGEPAEAAVPAIVKALGSDADAGVRTHAAWALGRIKSQAKESIAALVAALSDTEWTVRHNASLSLTWIGTPAAPALEAALDDTNPLKRVSAAGALLTIDSSKRETILPILLDLLDHEIPAVRTVAVTGIGQIGESANAAVPGLIALLDDPLPGLRKQAVEALGRIGQPAVPAIPGLIQVLKSDKDRANRLTAALSLGSLGSHDPEPVIMALIEALNDKDSRVRSYSANALGKLGKPAVPPLVEALDSDDPRLRALAMNALAIIGPPAHPAVGRLVAALDDRDDKVRIIVADTLGLIGVPDPNVQAALEKVRAAESGNTPLRAHIDRALATLNAKRKPD
jgi:HEAT repeat protein